MSVQLNIVLSALVLVGLSNGLPAANKVNRVPTLLVSMDGFRADKLDKFLSNNPNSFFQREFVELGVKADYMLPSFPSLTFPNHFTLVTGLNPESHGITGNTIYDPSYNLKVNLLRDKNSMEVQWWNNSEPIWLTAKRQGLKTSSFFWVGSEVWTRHPDIFLSYDNSYTFNQRCDEVISWFRKFEVDFATLYFNEPDHTGHEFGPDSEEYEQEIIQMDKTLGYLVERMRQAEILDKINIVVVSDHGMAAMENRTILISNYVDTKLIDSKKSMYGIVGNIYPVNESVRDIVYESLTKAKNLKVYNKEETPKELYYKNSDRIGPIVTVADEGFTLGTTVANTLKGNHGFNNSLESMRAIFLARGPSFEKNKKINGFHNVNVYPLLCEILKIECRPNNGTINTFSQVLKPTNKSSIIYSSNVLIVFILLLTRLVKHF